MAQAARGAHAVLLLHPSANVRVAVRSRRTHICSIGVNIFFKMVLNDNFIHADMHPGNGAWAVPRPAQPETNFSAA